jgi:hypothetical protein
LFLGFPQSGEITKGFTQFVKNKIISVCVMQISAQLIVVNLPIVEPVDVQQAKACHAVWAIPRDSVAG